MTQPTQAQIEAAAKAISEKRPVTYTQMAFIALTAAAQVGERHLGMFNEALATAIATHTIERCKRVVKEMTETTTFWRDDVLAALDKLKDAP